MTLKLYYHPLSSYCWKALIPLYENRTAFTPFQVDMDDVAVQAELNAAWPMDRFPVLKDEARGVVVPESSVIIEYLALHHPGPAALIPADPAIMIEARLMDRIFDNYVMTPMSAVVSDRLRPKEQRDRIAVDQARALLAKSYALLEARLAGRSWAAGEAFTLADCAAMPSLYYAEKILPFREGRPVLSAYFDRLLERPSVRRVLEEAGPYLAMFPQE